MKGPHLIVAPKSTINHWMKETNLWTPFLKMVNLIPTKDKRDEILANELIPGKFSTSFFLKYLNRHLCDDLRGSQHSSLLSQEIQVAVSDL